MNTEKYDEMDILDSLTLEILPRSGHQEVNLYDCPQYLPETDPLLLKAVETHRKQMNQNHQLNWWFEQAL